jgi:hypothetical protein
MQTLWQDLVFDEIVKQIESPLLSGIGNETSSTALVQIRRF